MSSFDAAHSPDTSSSPTLTAILTQQAKPDAAPPATTYPTHTPPALHPRAAESPCGHPVACISEVGTTRCCLWCEEVAALREANVALTRNNARLRAALARARQNGGLPAGMTLDEFVAASQEVAP
jgi:hypothetical protein